MPPCVETSRASNASGLGGLCGRRRGRSIASSPPAAKGSKASHQTQLQLKDPTHRTRGKQTSAVVEVDDGNDTQLDDDTEEHERKTAIAFLSKKAQLKKDIDAEMKKRGLKSYVALQLKVEVGKLTADDLVELRKTGDVEALLKTFETTAKSLQDLHEQLGDVDQDRHRA